MSVTEKQTEQSWHVLCSRLCLHNAHSMVTIHNKCRRHRTTEVTRSSAVTERLRDASCHWIFC